MRTFLGSLHLARRRVPGSFRGLPGIGHEGDGRQREAELFAGVHESSGDSTQLKKPASQDRSRRAAAGGFRALQSGVLARPGR